MIVDCRHTNTFDCREFGWSGSGYIIKTAPRHLDQMDLATACLFSAPCCFSWHGRTCCSDTVGVSSSRRAHLSRLTLDIWQLTPAYVAYVERRYGNSPPHDGDNSRDAHNIWQLTPASRDAYVDRRPPSCLVCVDRCNRCPPRCVVICDRCPPRCAISTTSRRNEALGATSFEHSTSCY